MMARDPQTTHSDGKLRLVCSGCMAPHAGIEFKATLSRLLEPNKRAVRGVCWVRRNYPARCLDLIFEQLLTCR